MITNNYSWTSILHSLDLIGTPRTWKRFPKKAIEQLESGAIPFDWVNLGTCGTSVGTFRKALSVEGVTPPRTGHIGDWKPIQELRAGPLDYNSAICAGRRRRYGRPLIFDLTQTDNYNASDGDIIYRPSGIFEHPASFHRLDLWCWNNGKFEPLDKDQTYYVPFVMVRRGDQFQSLSTFHIERNAIINLDCRYWSRIVCEHIDLVFAILVAVFQSIAAESRDDSRILHLLVDRISDRSGRVTRNFSAKAATDGGFEIGEVKYLSGTELAEACLIPFRAAASPDWWRSNIDYIKHTIPLLSNLTTVCLYAILNTHNDQLVREKQQNVIVHPHWGAIGMAGLPPFRRGYFASQAGSIRPVAQVFTNSMKQIGLQVNSLVLLLAPAAIFLLTTTSEEIEDEILLNHLLEHLLEKDSKLDADDFGAKDVQKIVKDWWIVSGSRMSPYWKAKFETSRTIGGASLVTRKASAVISPIFDLLSFRTLCMATGVLDSMFGSKL